LGLAPQMGIQGLMRLAVALNRSLAACAALSARRRTHGTPVFSPNIRVLVPEVRRGPPCCVDALGLVVPTSSPGLRPRTLCAEEVSSRTVVSLSGLRPSFRGPGAHVHAPRPPSMLTAFAIQVVSRSGVVLGPRREIQVPGVVGPSRESLSRGADRLAFGFAGSS